MSARTSIPETRASAAAFPSTQWTVVLQAGSAHSPNARAALEVLCRDYWSPLYAFLRRSDSALSPHDAKDLVQGFLARLIERGDLESVAPERGRFRTYLLTGLRNFTIKQALREKAAKRGGRHEWVTFDEGLAETLCGPDLRDGVSPEQAYDRQFARVALARALQTLRDEHRARRKEALFDALAPFLDGAEAGEYDAAAARLGLRRGTVAVTVHRMRARLQVLLRTEIQRTVGPGADADAEMRALLEVLATG